MIFILKSSSDELIKEIIAVETSIRGLEDQTEKKIDIYISQQEPNPKT